MFIRNPYNYDTNEASLASALHCTAKSKTRQDQAEDTDINVIVRRFKLTGEMPNNIKTPHYGDFTNIMDFKQAQQAIIDAEKEFLKLPAKVRSRFGHDPQQFLEFCENKENLPEMRELGLAKPEENATITTSP